MSGQSMGKILQRYCGYCIYALAFCAFLSLLISCAGRNAEKELIAACENGDLERVKEIIEQFPQLVNLKYVEHQRGEAAGMKYDYYSETTPLITATQQGFRDIVMLLCSNGANPNLYARSQYKVEIDEIRGYKKGDEGPLIYPVHFAVSNSQTDLLQILIQNNAQVNIENDSYGLLKVAIVSTGADAIFKSQDTPENRDPIGVLQILLDNGISLQKDESGYTPAHQCVHYGTAEALKMLVDKGASITEYDKSGRTPLGFARYLKKQDMVKFLESIGAPE